MKRKLSQRIMTIALLTVVPFILTACSDAAEKTKESEETEETRVTEAVQSMDIDKLCGMWIGIGYEDNQTGRYYSMEELGSEAALYVYSENGELYADYHYANFFTQDFNGMTVVVEENTSDKDADEPVSAVLENRFDESLNRRVTLVGENELMYREVYADGGQENVISYIFLRNNSEELSRAEDYRYRETVTVATVEELAEAIHSGTKIILKEGVYNFSELDPDKLRNPDVDRLGGIGGAGAEYSIRGVVNLCLEAEDCADVTVCTELASAAVLSFEECDNVVLRGITCGHEVEPGYCTGSVICLYDSNQITIEKCRLYGCGTYGVESHNVWELTVTDTDIYECSYGLVMLSQTYDAVFANCRLTESQQLAMFELMDCGNIQFENCEISRNTANQLIYAEYCWNTVFRNCKFTENQYWIFMNDVDGEENQNVTFENCVFDENNFFIGIDFWFHTMYNHQCCDARMYVTGPDSSVGRAED